MKTMTVLLGIVIGLAIVGTAQSDDGIVTVCTRDADAVLAVRDWQEARGPEGERVAIELSCTRPRDETVYVVPLSEPAYVILAVERYGCRSTTLGCGATLAGESGAIYIRSHDAAERRLTGDWRGLVRHELGHAFGLQDVYAGNPLGCAVDEHSVMGDNWTITPGDVADAAMRRDNCEK